MVVEKGKTIYTAAQVWSDGKACWMRGTLLYRLDAREAVLYCHPNESTRTRFVSTLRCQVAERALRGGYTAYVILTPDDDVAESKHFTECPVRRPGNQHRTGFGASSQEHHDGEIVPLARTVEERRPASGE